MSRVSRELLSASPKRWECIKEITQAIRKDFKQEVLARSYGHCCCTDYFGDTDVTKDYVVCKMFKGGINNDYNYDYGTFIVHDEVYYMWELENHKLDDIIASMQRVASKYNAVVVKPENLGRCIEVHFKKAE